MYGTDATTLIYDLGENAPYRITQPIAVTLSKPSDVVIASWPELDITAKGGDSFKALANLKVEICNRCAILTGENAHLGDRDKAQLHTLRAVIMRKSKPHPMAICQPNPEAL